jgi:hypothetical protein
MTSTNINQDFDPCSLNDNLKKKRRAAESVSFSDEDELTFLRYLVITTLDEQPITLSIFGVHKLFSCAVGDIISAKKLLNGSVLAEVRNKRQADAALNITTWVSQSVKVTAHHS